MKSDSRIQQDVLNELRWDTRVHESDIGVEVDNGTVTLTGAANSYAKRVAAQEAAHRVAGVLDVVNHIRVHLPGSLTRTDADVAHAVRHALEWDAALSAETIQMTVSDGWVTLEGEVGTWHEHDRAAQDIAGLAGVRGVINKIDVSLPYIRTEAIKEEIEQALERRAIRETKHIRIDVHNGVVTLTGPVQSWAEREAIIGAARYTPGVHKVEDCLQIEPLLLGASPPASVG
jgi:osmotically-inducible protein OsmY